jgi:UDPglucose 6-dehydrogenase
MTKYAANAMLATKISFMNEVATLCDAVGADVEEVRRGIGTDSRIGFQFIYPGLGFGGSCFPKDIRALERLGERMGAPQRIVAAVDHVNQGARERFVERVVEAFHGDLKGRTLAVWGLAFKPMTDDMREAPSVTIVEGLLEQGARVRAFDPVAMDVARGIFQDRVTLAENAYQAVEGADGLLLITEWNEFRHPDFKRVRSAMKDAPVVFDGRNIWDPKALVEQGFVYHGIGRPVSRPGS